MASQNGKEGDCYSANLLPADKNSNNPFARAGRIMLEVNPDGPAATAAAAVAAAAGAAAAGGAAVTSPGRSSNRKRKATEPFDHAKEERRHAAAVKTRAKLARAKQNQQMDVRAGITEPGEEELLLSDSDDEDDANESRRNHGRRTHPLLGPGEVMEAENFAQDPDRPFSIMSQGDEEYIGYLGNDANDDMKLYSNVEKQLKFADVQKSMKDEQSYHKPNGGMGEEALAECTRRKKSWKFLEIGKNVTIVNLRTVTLFLHSGLQCMSYAARYYLAKHRYWHNQHNALCESNRNDKAEVKALKIQVNQLQVQVKSLKSVIKEHGLTKLKAKFGVAAQDIATKQKLARHLVRMFGFTRDRPVDSNRDAMRAAGITGLGSFAKECYDCIFKELTKPLKTPVDHMTAGDVMFDGLYIRDAVDPENVKHPLDNDKARAEMWFELQFGPAMNRVLRTEMNNYTKHVKLCLGELVVRTQRFVSF